MQEETAVNVAKTSKLVPLVTEQYSDDMAEGLVAAQSPSPESQVKTGDTLVIVISKGKAPEKAKVPDVAGKSQSDAESAIEKAGFTVQTTKVYYDSVAKGKVITQQPEGGKSAIKGSKVQIVVSLGKGTGTATVPSVKGKSESSMRTRPSPMPGSRPRSSSSTATRSPRARSSTSSRPAARRPHPARRCSSRSRWARSPSGTVAVPDIMGMSEADAVSAIEDAGLVAQVQQLASADVPAGTVGYQFPAAGTQVAPGSEVLVAVSSGPSE